MTYISRNGKVWSMPFGAEYLGVDKDEVPLYYSGEGVGRMKQVTPRRIGDGGAG